MSITSKSFLFYLLVGSILFSSCVKKLDNPQWNTDNTAPIAKSVLSLKNIVADSLIQINSDSSLSLVYSQEIYRTVIDSGTLLNAKPFTKTEKLQTLQLGTQTVIQKITLGQIASQAGLAGNLIIAQNGGTAIIPAFPGLTAGPFPLSINNFLITADIKTGNMDVTLDNGLPSDVSNVIYEIRNSFDNSLVALDTFNIIPAHTAKTRTAILDGKTVKGNLNVSIINMDVVGTNPTAVPIDTSDAVIAIITLKDIKLLSATAIFPAQEVLAVKQNQPLDSLGTKELTFAKVKSGFVKMEVVSTVQSKLFFTYAIPVATLNGVPFIVNNEVPAAPPGGSSSINLLYDFTGYDLDLRSLPADTFNALYTEINGRIDSTGQITTLSLNDSIFVNFTVIDLVPDYVKGYLGSDTFNITTTTQNLNVLPGIKAGAVTFDDAKISLTISNGVGVEGLVSMGNLNVKNTNTGNTLPLDISSLPNPLIVGQATDNPFTKTTSQFSLNNSNSNTASVLNLIPNQVSFDMQVIMNAGINDGTRQNFIYADRPLIANLDIEVPMSLIAKNLILTDTTVFYGASIPNPENINVGSINVIVENGFPLEASLKMILLNSLGTVIDSLINPEVILAADLVNGTVLIPKKSKLVYVIDALKTAHLQETTQIIFTAQFDSKPDNTSIKIYSDYSIDFSITTNFQLKIN